MVLAIELELAQRADVAAGAEGAITGALDHHRMHMRLIPPALQHLGQRLDHRQIQRVQRLRAVQHDPPNPPVTAREHGPLGQFPSGVLLVRHQVLSRSALL